MQPRSDTALLIVDMINLFDFEGGRPLAEAAAAIAPRIARLRQRFDDAGAPTLYVNDNFANWRGEFRDLLGACLEAEGPPSEIVRHLAPRAHDYYVLKPKHSGFLGTPLAILLAKLGMPRLVLAACRRTPASWPPHRARTCVSTTFGCRATAWRPSRPNARRGH
mgnify:CR=1 FL=1